MKHKTYKCTDETYQHTCTAFPARGTAIAVVCAVCVICYAHTSCALNLPDAPFQMEKELSDFLDSQPYEIGFYAKVLGEKKTVERFEERSVCLASMVKLFCLTELYRQKHEQGLDLARKIEVAGRGEISLKEAADLMIGESDNPATYALAALLGWDNVNKIPSLLSIDTMSPEILPEERVLRQTLDKRIAGNRIAEANLPQHGTATGMVEYLELLLNKKVFSEAISEDIIAFLTAHPRPYSTCYAGKCEIAGKGGNILWTRPPKHFSMMGWAVFVKMPSGCCIVLCVWGEWFPETMPPEQQTEFLRYVTDCILSLLDN